MKRQFSNPWLSVVLALLLLFITAGSAGAITYDITAEATSITMPDGVIIPAWGYRLSSDPAGSATVPGPVIDVPAGDSTLIINLTNSLPAPEVTSLQILGQTMTAPGAPTYVGGRVMSFVKETANGATTEYRWDNFSPGTHMLQSATHPARQVQMGLFAAIKADFGANEAYPGVTYGEERILVFHEIDPDFHNSPDTASIVHRHPRYYLINGAAYPQTILAGVGAGQSVLLRFINAGLETHVPQILNKYFTLVAQDGIRRSYDQEVYGFELNSAGTMDAMLQVTAGDAGVSFPIYDARTKHLTNSGQSFGGMLVKLNVGAVGGNQPPVPVADSFPATIDTLLSVPAPGVLGNDTDPEGDPLTAALASPTANGATVLNPDGSFTYTPNAGFTGVDSFTYTVSDGTSVSAPITATLYVNPPNIAPTAVDDTFNGTEGATASVPAPGVLTNDTDPEGDALTAALSSGPASGTLTFNTDGSFTFDGPAGTHTFTYVANDGTLDSAPATVTIEINDLPSASDDAYGTEENVDLNVGTPGVLGNDSDANPAGGTLTAALVSTTSQGILTFNPDGSFTYEPGFNFSGTDTFTYQVADDLGATGGPATVTITVNETADTVTITRLRWRNNQTRVRIIATSSAPAGSVVLTASANFNDGNPAQVLGTLRYNANAGNYRRTLRFDTARGLPASITVTSDQGGSDTQSIPFN